MCACLYLVGSMCRFQQLTAYDQDLPGDSIKVVNAHGSCLSPLNITARSLAAVQHLCSDPAAMAELHMGNIK